MDWVLLRDGDGSGSDSDEGGSRARVPGGSDSASEDGSDSGFAIVRVRRDRPAGAGVSPVDGVVSDAPAMVAVPRPTPPGLCFKVVSYGEAFSASSSSSTDGGADFLDETTIREALFGAAACSRGAGEIDDGDTVTHEEDRESEVCEHDGAGSSPRTSSASGTTVSPCKAALPVVASGVEKEDAESSGEEEDMENSGEDEEDDDECSGEEDTEISEEEEEDTDGESSSEDCFEIPATRHTASDADGKGEQPAFPGRSYDDIDDSDGDTVPSSRICTTHNAEQATGIEVPAPLFFWIDEDHQLDDMEEEGSSEPIRREYDGIDDSCGMEESDCDEECDEDDDIEGSEVEESGTEEDDVATDADVEYVHDAENQRPEFVGRSYDDIDSGSDMEEEVATEPRASRVPRPLSEFFFERAARASPQVRLPQLPEFVCRSYDDIDSDCDAEDGAASSEAEAEAEESCCEEEGAIAYPEPEEEERSSDEGESDSEVAYDVNGSAVATSCVVEEDQPAAESRGGRKYDDIDTSESEMDEGDNTASSDTEEEEEVDDDDDAIHGVCGLCGHIVELGTRPVELGSITEFYSCFDPEAIVRPARVVCKNGKAICIVYDDGEQSVYNPRPEATAGGGGAEEHVEPARSRYEYDDIDTDTEDGGAQFTAQAGRQEELALEDLKRRAMAEETPDVEDLLLEMLEELEPAQPKHARRVEAESDAPPAVAHVQEEHAGLTLCAMVYLLVYLATGGFFFF